MRVLDTIAMHRLPQIGQQDAKGQHGHRNPFGCGREEAPGRTGLMEAMPR